MPPIARVLKPMAFAANGTAGGGSGFLAGLLRGVRLPTASGVASVGAEPVTKPGQVGRHEAEHRSSSARLLAARLAACCVCGSAMGC